ncbi:hypothetical protein NA57DRAFT_9498, partial [Rhizodiscina lignyota]
EDLDESSDEDFNPAAHADNESASSSESDGGGTAAAKATSKKAPKKRKRAELDAALDSGDEETIQERRKKKRKAKGKGKGAAGNGDEDDFVYSEDEGREGGLIKTRAQRRTEVKERRPLAGIEGATADVDAIWARLSGAPIGGAPGSVLGGKEVDAKGQENKENINGSLGEEEYITIKRTYEFAGEVKTEERRVPKHSAEAKVYLESQAAKGDKSADNVVEGTGTEDKLTRRRPVKRPSRFEPNPEGLVRGLPDKLQLRFPRATVQVKVKPADKINTVDKSRIDWAGYVDKAGIADELDEYGRAKTNFMERSEFLARSEARREEQGHAARM